MYINRDISDRIKLMARGFPIIGVFGPRQSGKTTLIKRIFPDYEYLNLENINNLVKIKEDPYTYLISHKNGLIIDEAQKFPELFSFLQVVVDELGTLGKYVISGSENYLLSSKVSQSLAGRIGITTLLPLSYNEQSSSTLEENIFRGSYPALAERKVNALDYYESYISTYIERDVRNITSIVNLDKFYKVIRSLAFRVGNILNYEDICKDTGVDRDTLENWISILNATYIIYTLSPYYRNFGKRIVKTPKIYFYDTGIICRLLGISNTNELLSSDLFGRIYENYVITEIKKNNVNFGINASMYYWRDSNKNEIDLIIDKGSEISAIEIKSSIKVIAEDAEKIVWFNNSVFKDAKIALFSRSTQKSINAIPNYNVKHIKDYLVRTCTNQK